MIHGQFWLDALGGDFEMVQFGNGYLHIGVTDASAKEHRENREVFAVMRENEFVGSLM